jgi:hypothetical protein
MLLKSKFACIEDDLDYHGFRSGAFPTRGRLSPNKPTLAAMSIAGKQFPLRPSNLRHAHCEYSNQNAYPKMLTGFTGNWLLIETPANSRSTLIANPRGESHAATGNFQPTSLLLGIGVCCKSFNWAGEVKRNGRQRNIREEPRFLGN